MTAAGSVSIGELVSEVAALRQENEKLRARVEAVEQATATVRPSGESVADVATKNRADGFSRRDLMRRGGVAALAGLGAAVAGGLLTAGPAAADNGDKLVLGHTNSATAPTAIAVSDPSTFSGEYGFGVTDHGLGAFPESAAIAGHANSEYDNAVLGYNENGGTGVRGIADGGDGWGAHGSADGIGGFGLVGTAKTGAGVVGISGDVVLVDFGSVGVGGVCDSGTGIVGLGRIGGGFEGSDAQIALVPGHHSTHPTKGDRGSLYVDKTGRLWYCRTGGKHAVWHQLA